MSTTDLPAALQWLYKYSHTVDLDDKKETFFQFSMSYVEDTNAEVTSPSETCEVLLHAQVVELIALCYDMAFKRSEYRPPEVECRIFASDANAFGGDWPLMNIIPLEGIRTNSLGLFVRMIHDMIHSKLDRQLRVQIGSPDLVEFASLHLHIANENGLRLSSCRLHESPQRAWTSDVVAWALRHAQYQPPTTPWEGSGNVATTFK